MVTVRFLVDYRGALTAGEYFRRGQVAEFPRNVADELIEAGRWATEVVPPQKKSRLKKKSK